jgi:hypothetical protein
MIDMASILFVSVSGGDILRRRRRMVDVIHANIFFRISSFRLL